ncbi:MAG: hypothetical protein ACREBD_06520 [Blastocatellia bacterium]
MDFYQFRLAGFDAGNTSRLLLTLGFILLVLLLRWGLIVAARLFLRGDRQLRIRLWTGQSVRLALAALVAIALLSIWMDDPGRLTALAGLITAGLAVAQPRVGPAIAGYFATVRSRVFSEGNRIRMGSARGAALSPGQSARRTARRFGQSEVRNPGFKRSLTSPNNSDLPKASA